jgi:hypothetical protein
MFCTSTTESGGLTYKLPTLRSIEVRDAADIDEAVQSALSPNNGSPMPGGAGGSSSAANHSHGKPQRPGRGKVKVSKFKLDEEG